LEIGWGRWRLFRTRLLPKPFGDGERINLHVLPPGRFIAGLVQLAMMRAAQGHGELIADFEPLGVRLRKSQMMRIGGVAAALRNKANSRTGFSAD
jgi:hypothetical protein